MSSPKKVGFNRQEYILILTLDEVDTYINEKREPKTLHIFSRIHELYPDPNPRISLIYTSPKSIPRPPFL